MSTPPHAVSVVRPCYTRKMFASPFAVTHEPLELDALIRTVMAALKREGTSAGAIASFVGTVRGDNLGRTVLRLEYEAYEQISDEACARWPQAQLAIHHRLGPLLVGDPSVVIAAAAPHRAEAFASCRFAIERVKQIAPVWKHEFFEGGDVWVEGATSDPDDEAVRDDAYRRACV